MGIKTGVDALWVGIKRNPICKKTLGSKILPKVIGHFIPGTWITSQINRRLISSLLMQIFLEEGGTSEEENSPRIENE